MPAPHWLPEPQGTTALMDIPETDHSMGRIALDVAVDQLLNPTLQPITREVDEQSKAVAAEDEADLEALDQAATWHRTHLDRARRAGARGEARRSIDALARIATHRERLTARIAARTSSSAQLPSLLEQLEDAVHSSTSTGGHGSVGALRSPIGLAAAELLARIDRTIGPSPMPRPAGETLARRIYIWDPAEPGYAAEHVETWLAEGRALLAPRRTMEAKAPCPVCGHRYAWVDDPERGERVRKAAIQIDYDTRSARCIYPGCTGYWDRHHLLLLAGVLQQDTAA